ncbi:Ferredoxin reductase [Leucobacter sp. 7(1)]|uniref:NAD(P)/FAD-dependent oxidoreductase n=1 Tax=Leucobacter sp. 7(1) TaxID=1255613 RepID=UPI00097EC713|nr:FAD-dependent oxidoreductase [Leucobacter sp. 7(1)]SJN11215.1 Ferredoxin reductase [Leucobacter sp. 7(1)]
MTRDVVIIGAGQAGLTAAVSLRERGWTGGIHLIGDEAHDPYQRPPLSKGYLSGTESALDLLLRAPEALERDGITQHRGVRAEELDRSESVVRLSSGRSVTYTAVILATGSAPRRLTVPGSELGGIHSVRTIVDVDALRADLAHGGPTVFIGGGFLNLEVAVEAAKFGPVTVLERGSQILGRVLSPAAAAALAGYHAEKGVDIRCEARVVALTAASQCAAGPDSPHVPCVGGVTLADGSIVPAARVVLAIGAEPRDELARASGLETGGGVVVRGDLRTADERVYAIGDCARFPSTYAGTEMRVESVQNATDQARYVAGVIAARFSETGPFTEPRSEAQQRAPLTGASDVPAPYREVPWFWSTQGDRRLQIAGIAMPGDDARVLLDEPGGKLVVERLRAGEVVAVETINAPGPHMRARRALASYGL